jgi:hypothetical protein
MKVKLRKPISWFGPYQLAEVLCFWVKKEHDEYGFDRTPDWVHTFGEKLSNTWLSPFLQWVNDTRQKFPWNKDVVKIDYWDTWSMDHTLAPIILPMLKQLKATKHGYGMIEDEDVPKELSSIYAPAKESWEWDGNAEKRYDWVLNEMIWSFEQLCDDDAESKFWITQPQMDWDAMKEPFPVGQKTREVTWKVEGKLDTEGLNAHNARVQRGLTLFGKYFRTLWD